MPSTPSAVSAAASATTFRERRLTFTFVAVVIVLVDASAAVPARDRRPAEGARQRRPDARLGVARRRDVRAQAQQRALALGAAGIGEEANRIVSGAHARLPRLSACGAGSPVSSPTAAPNAARARRSRE